VARELGVDRARLDQRDADVVRDALLAQRLAERADTELGEVVDAGAGAGDPPGDRGDVDDVPAALLAHQRQCRVRAVEDAEDVRVEHPAPLVRRRVLDRAQQHHASVVDEHVEAAELFVGAAHERIGLGLVADVGLDGERGSAGRADALGERVDAVGAARGERDGGAGLGAGERGGLADAR